MSISGIGADGPNYSGLGNRSGVPAGSPSSANGATTPVVVVDDRTAVNDSYVPSETSSTSAMTDAYSSLGSNRATGASLTGPVAASSQINDTAVKGRMTEISGTIDGNSVTFFEQSDGDSDDTQYVAGMILTLREGTPAEQQQFVTEANTYAQHIQTIDARDASGQHSSEPQYQSLTKAQLTSFSGDAAS